MTAGEDRLDALERIAQDHATIRELFDFYDECAAAARRDPRMRREAAVALTRALEAHAAVETELFYRALADVLLEGNRLRDAYDEHIEMLQAVRRLRATPIESPEHQAGVAHLRRVAEHHIAEEETYLFAGARRAGIDLAALGRAMARRRDDLQGAQDDAGDRGSSRGAPRRGVPLAF